MRTVLHEIVETAPDLRPITRNKYLRDLDAWVSFVGPDPANWTRQRAQGYYQSMLDRGLAPRSANRAMASIRYASKWWAHRENRPELDFGVVRKAKDHGPKRARRSIAPEHAQKLVAACMGDTPLDLRDLALITVGLETGMRRMSLISMEWETTRLVPVMQQNGYQRTYVLMKDHGNERVSVPLSDVACFALARWFTWLAKHGVSGTGPVFRAITRRMNKRGTVEIKPSKSPLSETAVQKLVLARGRQAGIGHIHPHLFRHTFITWRSGAGFKPIEISSITGHSLDIGAMGDYYDMEVVGGTMRNTTPAWLSEMIFKLRS